MAKGDKTRQQNKVDEQQKQSQTYLTGVQSQLGNQYGNAAANYTNTYTPNYNQQYGSVYGVGTTVPQYNLFNQPTFSGNGTGTQYTGGIGGNSMQGGGGNFGAAEFAQLTNGLPPTPQTLEALEPVLAQRGIKVLTNASGVKGKIQLPNGQIVDVIHGAGAGGLGWQYETGGGTSFGGGGGLMGGGGYGAGAQIMPGGMMALPGYAGILGKNLGDYDNIMGRYQNFADTGGYSEQDKANIRARAISPIRSVYSRARQELDRHRALQSGYSPGFQTALGRFAREQGQQTSDATTNAEAAIAQMVQQGKLAGMGGMAGLYGTAPGLASMYGNQALGFQNALGGQGLQAQGLAQQYALQSMNQQLTAANLQNQIGSNMIQGQYQNSQIPNNFTSTLQNIGQIGQAAGAIYPWLESGSNFLVNQSLKHGGI